MLAWTKKGSYLVSCPKAIQAAEQAGLVYESDAIARHVQAGLDQIGWQGQVPAMILDGKFQEALDRLDAAEKQIGDHPADPEEPVRLRLWRPCAFARMTGETDRAISQYQAVADDDSSPAAARAFSRICQLYLLHRSRRYPDTVALYDQLIHEFPQVAESTLLHQSSPAWCLMDARRHLPAASQPDAKARTQ